MDITQVVATNLKRIRDEKHVTLEELAKSSGVSKGMLSQIEKGTTNPTINTLWKICTGLDIPYTLLMEQPAARFTIVKKDEAIFQSANDGHYRLFDYFQSMPGRNFEMFQVELDHGDSYTSIGHSHESEEYLMVLEGQLTLTVHDEDLVVNADDAISFDPMGKHIYTNTGAGTLKVMLINFYPVK